jgi:hypothetical protein
MNAKHANPNSGVDSRKFAAAVSPALIRAIIGKGFIFYSDRPWD